MNQLVGLDELLSAAWVSMSLFLHATLFGTIFGLILGILSAMRFVGFSKPAMAISAVVRGIPALVILYLVFFGMPALVNVPVLGRFAFISSYWSAVVGLSLWFGAYTAEVVRSGILSVDKGQLEAATALGMHSMRITRRIKLPEATRIAMPPFTNNLVLLVKMTSLTSVIAVYELTAASNRIVSQTFRPVETILIVIVIYAIWINVLTVLQMWFERRIRIRE